MTSPVGPEEGYQPFVSALAWQAGERPSAWADFVIMLDAARAGATTEDLDRALEFAMRSAAIETGAIEGLYQTTRGITRTVALQGAMWEAALEEIGPEVRGHFEAQLDALEHVLDAITASRPITEVWIRELHAMVCRQQSTYRVSSPQGLQEHQLPHGMYKTQANHVLRPDGLMHMYCSVDDTPAEMARLVREIASDKFAGLPVVVQSAFAHHAFTSIHPFADGNGRVARALASVFLYRGVGVPLVIFSDQQERYWDTLLAADHGAHAEFTTFIEDRAMDTMAMVADRLREAANPLSGRASAIRSLFHANSGMTYAEVEACGQRLAGDIQRLVGEVISDIGLPEDLQRGIEGMGGGKVQCDFGRPYHTLQQGGAFHYTLQTRAPVASSTRVSPVVGVADSRNERFAFIVIDVNRQASQPLMLRVDDIHPGTTAAAEARIRSWVVDDWQRALQELQAGIEIGLRQQGFRS